MHTLHVEFPCSFCFVIAPYLHTRQPLPASCRNKRPLILNAYYWLMALSCSACVTFLRATSHVFIIANNRRRSSCLGRPSLQRSERASSSTNLGTRDAAADRGRISALLLVYNVWLLFRGRRASVVLERLVLFTTPSERGGFTCCLFGDSCHCLGMTSVMFGSVSLTEPSTWKGTGLNFPRAPRSARRWPRDGGPRRLDQ